MLFIHIYLYTYVYISIYIHTNKYIYICIYVYLYKHVFSTDFGYKARRETYIQIYIYVYMYICIFVFSTDYIYICIYVYLYSPQTLGTRRDERHIDSWGISIWRTSQRLCHHGETGTERICLFGATVCCRVLQYVVESSPCCSDIQKRT